MIKIWIGRRESDILTYIPNKFNYSITYYGSNNQVSNFAFNNKKRAQAKYSTQFYTFIICCIKKLCNDNSDFELYFYNSTLSKDLGRLQPSLKKHFKNCNNYILLDWLNNKSYTRLWLSNCVAVPPFTLLSKEECCLSFLNGKFPDHTEYILQKNYSSGGKGTYHLTQENESTILNQLSSFEPYLASPYLVGTISACCHVIIGEKDTIIFPIGYQILSENGDTMSYLGTTYKKPPCFNITESRIKEFILNISIRLAKNGYRGICGYDFLIKEGQPILIEINPRYMASSYLLNYVLLRENLPSLFELNDMAFANDTNLYTYQESIYNLKVPYITRTIYYSAEFEKQLPHEYELLFNDGLENVCDFEEKAYLYRYIFRY